MEIQIEKLDKLVKEADKIFLTPEGESVLEQLLNIQDQVECAIKEAEARLEKAGLKENPDFRGIMSDKIRVSYRFYGSQYYIDESLLPEIPEILYKKEVKTTYKVLPDMVDMYAEQHKGLPRGIREVERAKKLSFTRKDKKDEQTHI